MNIYRRFILRSSLSEPFEALRQVLYLVPVVAIPLFLVLLAYLPYINQLVFLEQMEYVSYSFCSYEQKPSEAFGYTKSLAFVRKDNAGKVAVRGVESFFFRPGESVSFQSTPFKGEMIMEGKGAQELDSGEVILSLNVAQSLDVAIGDTVLLAGDDRLLSNAQEYRVAGLLEPKYPYGDIDKRWGVALAAIEPAESALLIEKAVAFNLSQPTQDQEGVSVTLEDEKSDAGAVLSQGRSYLLLLLAAVLLIVIIMSKELTYKMKKRKEGIGILVALGGDVKRIFFWLALEEYVTLLISTLFSLGLVAAFFSWNVFELYVSPVLFLRLYCSFAAIECLLVGWFFHERGLERQ